MATAQVVEEIARSSSAPLEHDISVPVREERRGRLLAALRCNRPVYVALVELNRGFGGRAEGGWWYDIQEPVEQVPATNIAAINAAITDLQSRYDNDGRHEPDSVLCAGWYEIRVSTKPVMREPREQPRYE